MPFRIPFFPERGILSRTAFGKEKGSLFSNFFGFSPFQYGFRPVSVRDDEHAVAFVEIEF